MVREAKRALEAKLVAALQLAEAEAEAAFGAGDDAKGLAILSEHAIDAGATATAAWRELWQALLVKFIDGRVTKPDPTDGVCGCEKASAQFSDAWKTKLIADTGDKYLQPATAGMVEGAAHARPTRPKLSIRGVN